MTVLFEWTGGVGQFETSPETNDGPGSGALSLAEVPTTGALNGRVLRFQQAALTVHPGANPAAYWLVKASEVTLPRRYWIEMDVWASVAIANRGGGLALQVDSPGAGGLHALGWHYINAATLTRDTAGVGGAAIASSNLCTSAGGKVVIEVEAEKVAATNPTFFYAGRGIQHRLTPASILGHGVSQQIWGGGPGASGFGAMAGSWASASPTRFGLALLAASNHVTADFIDIENFRIHEESEGIALPDETPVTPPVPPSAPAPLEGATGIAVQQTPSLRVPRYTDLEITQENLDAFATTLNEWIQDVIRYLQASYRVEFRAFRRMQLNGRIAMAASYGRPHAVLVTSASVSATGFVRATAGVAWSWTNGKILISAVGGLDANIPYDLGFLIVYPPEGF